MLSAEAVIGHARYHEDKNEWNRILQDLAEMKAITLAESMFAGSSVAMLPAGRIEVEERRQRRSDTELRRQASQDAVLAWIAVNPGEDNIDALMSDPDFFFEGRPLGPRDVGTALSSLQNQCLVTGNRVHETALLGARLTPDGLHRFSRMRGDVPNSNSDGMTTNNINFHGPVSGNVAWSNQSVSQSATTSGLAGEELSVLVHALMQAVPTLNLSNRDANSLDSDLRNVDDELSRPQPAKGIVATYLGRAMATMGRQGGNALALVLGAYTKHLLSQMGLSPE
jgi:hypothetical protein